MGRSRSRSRERERRRKRSRSRSRSRRRRYRSRSRGREHERSRSHFNNNDVYTRDQPLGIQEQQPMAATNITFDEAIDRKRREVYIGNLAIGQTTSDVLNEFFNQALAHLVPDPLVTPPVVNINMDSLGRFAFVEFQTYDLCENALLMDRQIEIHGKAMHIGRPKGYVELAPGEVLPPPRFQAVSRIGVPGISLSTGPKSPTLYVLLLAPHLAGEMRDADERKVLEQEVRQEASKHSLIEEVVVPKPPSDVQDRMPARIYVKFASFEDAAKVKSVFHTRTLNEVKINAVYVSEDEYNGAVNGEWAVRQTNVAGIPLPGLYTLTPLAPGLTGLTALNPALAASVQTNPSLAAMMVSDINEDEVPYEEGYVKLRGFPSTVTKVDMATFFSQCGADIDPEQDIKTVCASDGAHLGEAYIRLKGPNTKLRLALARIGLHDCCRGTTVGGVDGIRRRSTTS